MRSTGQSWELARHFGTSTSCHEKQSTPRQRVYPRQATTGAVKHIPQPDPTVVDGVRLAMRDFPQPLVVVSAYPTNPSHAPQGMLVSSFRTIALDPTPYVSFTIRLPSRTLDAITAAKGVFHVSAINDITVADWWSKRAASFQDDSPESREVMEQQLGAHLRDGRRWLMVCRLLEDRCIDLDQHLLVVAEVQSAREPAAGSAQRLRKVLLWLQGEVNVPSDSGARRMP